MLILLKEELVEGFGLKIASEEVEMCTLYMKSIIRNVPFTENVQIKTSKLLELTHSDVCGPL